MPNSLCQSLLQKHILWPCSFKKWGEVCVINFGKRETAGKTNMNLVSKEAALSGQGASCTFNILL